MNGTFTIENNMLIAYSGDDTTVIIPEGITVLRDKPFLNCTHLKEVILPESVRHLGAGCFKGCTALETITLPSGIEKIGNDCFADCTSLREIVIPASVATFGKRLFQNCTALTDVTLPECSIIPERMFDGCIRLQKLTIPETVTEIAEGAFRNCKSLQSVFLPDSVMSIGNNAFAGCCSLQEVRFPDTAVAISQSAFDNEEMLHRAYLHRLNYRMGKSNKAVLVLSAYADNLTPEQQQKRVQDLERKIGETGFLYARLTLHSNSNIYEDSVAVFSGWNHFGQLKEPTLHNLAWMLADYFDIPKAFFVDTEHCIHLVHLDEKEQYLGQENHMELLQQYLSDIHSESVSVTTMTDDVKYIDCMTRHVRAYYQFLKPYRVFGRYLWHNRDMKWMKDD